MLTREQILGLIPHQGTMCLLDRVLGWSAAEISCIAISHLAPDNPLRRDGQLGAICGIEYGLQAAALHGALVQWGAMLAVPAVEAAAQHTTASGLRAAVAPAGTAATGLGSPTPAYLASLRAVALNVERLDDPVFGLLRVTAEAELVAPSGSIYRFTVASESARPLLRGRATIAFPGHPA
ncbi:MAG TPA: hypothetical protein VMU81_06430 [Acetobacteraceae bacterium]|jgi:hypothetical protein|nr:hypothetical protein [Acetobacteraceae bacterium]